MMTEMFPVTISLLWFNEDSKKRCWIAELWKSNCAIFSVSAVLLYRPITSFAHPDPDSIANWL